MIFPTELETPALAFAVRVAAEQHPVQQDELRHPEDAEPAQVREEERHRVHRRGQVRARRPRVNHSDRDR